MPTHETSNMYKFQIIVLSLTSKFEIFQFQPSKLYRHENIVKIHSDLPISVITRTLS